MLGDTGTDLLACRPTECRFAALGHVIQVSLYHALLSRFWFERIVDFTYLGWDISGPAYTPVSLQNVGLLYCTCCPILFVSFIVKLIPVRQYFRF